MDQLLKDNLDRNKQKGVLKNTKEDNLDPNKQIKILKNLEEEKIFFIKKSKGKGEHVCVKELTFNFDKYDKEKFISELVDTCIRKKLRRNKIYKRVEAEDTKTKVYVPDIVKQLLKALCAASDFKMELDKIAEEELYACMLAINEDYSKSKHTEQITKSIQQQNVKVQTKKTGGQVLLQLANAEHPKKKYAFEFIKKYANADNAGKNEMLKQFQNLMTLFYFGKEEYCSKKEDAYSVWNAATISKYQGQSFCQEASNLLLLIKKKELSKAELKGKTTQIKRLLRSEITKRYLDALNVIFEEKGLTLGPEKRESFIEEEYWLQFIERYVEKKLVGNKRLKEHHLELVYLCRSTWKEFLSFIAIKFMDMGKAVYHFAMPDLRNLDSSEPQKIGYVLPPFQGGISSFDYERIKADENIERNLMTYINFAVNNFSRVVCSDEIRKNNEDILQISLGRKILQPYLKQRILQYYGGASRWESLEFRRNEEIELVGAIQKCFQMVRNLSFHYTSDLDENAELSPIIDTMFQKEYRELGQVYRKKYYSNNIPMFYRKEDIDRFMEALYGKPKEHFAQVPSFHRILSKKQLPDFLKAIVDGEALSKLSSKDQNEKYRSAIYFMLKEIYYYGFLSDPFIVIKFEKTVKDYIKKLERKQSSSRLSNEEKTHLFAAKNFRKRYFEIKNESDKSLEFGEVCQQYMTDYNLQNTDNKEVRKNNIQKGEKSYGHFPMLLYLFVRETFRNYLNDMETQGEKLFAFLRRPTFNENIFKTLTQEQFCADWEVHTFDDLEGTNRSLSMAWYTAAHFLMPKQLNHLIGDIKNYLQYIKDIRKRCIANGHNEERMGMVEERISRYENVLKVLEFVSIYSGQISPLTSDYFGGKDDAEINNNYAEYIKQYVELGNGNHSASYLLEAFCEEDADKSPTGKIDIYYRDNHPIVNRNIVITKLYGNEKILSACLSEHKVSIDEIKNYYKQRVSLEPVFKRGICVNKEEQKKLRQFQQMKNRIELYDLAVYSEIVNDLLTQLISWAYLRERDLMYFQLGLYYMKLFYSGEDRQYPPEHKFRKIINDQIRIEDGALLYQIAAMYTPELQLYDINEDEESVIIKEKNKSIGAGVKAFCKNYADSATYEAGMNLFQYMEEEPAIVEFRNYVAHFKYYTWIDRSILDMYSEIYDRFFTYNPNLQKSVSFILKNILKDYGVIANFRMTFEEGNEEQEEKNNKKRKITKIEFSVGEPDQTERGKKKASKTERSEVALRSDYYTYKLKVDDKNMEKVKISIRTKLFLEQLKEILEYSDESDKQ